MKDLGDLWYQLVTELSDYYVDIFSDEDGKIVGRIADGDVSIGDFDDGEVLFFNYTGKNEAVLKKVITIINSYMGYMYDCHMEAFGSYISDDDYVTYCWANQQYEYIERVFEFRNNFYPNGKFYFGSEIIENSEDINLDPTKVLGEYLDDNLKKSVDSMNEFDVFLMITRAANQLLSAKFEYTGDDPNIDFSKLEYFLEYLVYHTRTFGVELPEARPNKHVVVTPSYYKWYNFYKEIYDSLSVEEINEYMDSTDNRASYSFLADKGNWHNYTKKAKRDSVYH